MVQDKKWGYIDRKGEYVINPLFDETWDFSGGLARVKASGGFGYIDKTGNYVWNPTK